MTGQLYLFFLVLSQCGHAVGYFVSQMESTVRVQPGLSTSLECQVLLEGRFSISWIKIPPNKAPVCVATAKSLVDSVDMCEHFVNHARIKVTWNQKTFNLLFSSVEQTDVATYFCGMYSYKHFFFGNGSKLILEHHVDDVSPNTPTNSKEKNDVHDGKNQLFGYLVPVLAATNAASIFLIVLLIHLSKKKRSGAAGELSITSDKKTEEVNYAALNFGNKQRRTVPKRTDLNSTVIYGAVRHQEEI